MTNLLQRIKDEWLTVWDVITFSWIHALTSAAVVGYTWWNVREAATRG